MCSVVAVVVVVGMHGIPCSQRALLASRDPAALPATTLVLLPPPPPQVRNIPNKYTQEMMLSVLHKSGFRWAA